MECMPDSSILWVILLEYQNPSDAVHIGYALTVWQVFCHQIKEEISLNSLFWRGVPGVWEAGAHRPAYSKRDHARVKGVSRSVQPEIKATSGQPL